MSALLLVGVLLSAHIDPAPVAAHEAVAVGVSGQSFQYAPGLFRLVAQHRGMALDPAAAGYASVPQCRYVQPTHPWYVVVRWADGRIERDEIVDCSQVRDLPAQQRKRLVVEVDWASALRGHWATYAGATGPGHAPVTVLRYER